MTYEDFIGRVVERNYLEDFEDNGMFDILNDIENGNETINKVSKSFKINFNP